MKTSLVLALMILAPAFGASNPLMCDSTVKDLGLIEEGQKAAAQFSIMNPLSETVCVDRVVTSCGCIVTSKMEFTLDPNQGTEIFAEFNSSGYGGVKLEKTISFHVKADKYEPLVLTVKAQIKGIPPEKHIIIMPNEKTIDGDPNKKHTLYLQVPAEPNIAFTIQPPEWLSFSLQKSRQQSIPGAVIWEVEISPKKRLRERVVGELVVNSNCAKFEKVKAPIQVMPKPVFMFEPYMIVFKKGKASQVQTVVIKSGDCRVESVYSSIDVKSSKECLKVKRTNNLPAREIMLEVTNDGCDTQPARLEVLVGREVVAAIPVLFN